MEYKAYYTLEQKIIDWHNARNLIEGSTDHQQFEKLLEEVEELRVNIEHSQDFSDDVGDILVVLINLCERHNLTLTDCMNVAYNDIKYRTGKMVDGLFVKDLVDDSGRITDNTTENDLLAETIEELGQSLTELQLVIADIKEQVNYRTEDN